MSRIQNGVVGNSDMFFYSSCQNKDLFFYPLSAGHFFCNENYRVERKSFNSILVTFIKDGELNFINNGREQTVFAGDVAVIDCFNSHSYYTKSFFEAYWIHVAGANTYYLYNELKNRYGNIFKCTEAVKDKIINLYRIIKYSSIINDFEMSLKVYELMAALFFCEEEDNKNSLIKKSLKYISDNYSENITVKDIADSVNMSESHFSRIFKKTTGTTPYGFLLNLRTAKAKELLKNTDLQVGEIAYLSGFSDASNFIYVFRRKEGVSPLQFRKMLF